MRQLEGLEKERIRDALQHKPQDIKELLRGTSRLLSQYGRQAGVVLWPKLSIASFKHIEFLRLGSHHIVAILISKAGLVHQTHIESDEEITQAELDKYGRAINELLQNVPISMVKERLLEEMASEKALFDQLFSRALKMAQQAIQDTIQESDIYIEGQTNLLDNPEFADVEANEAYTPGLRGQIQNDTVARRDIEGFVGDPDNSGNRGRTPGGDEPDLVSLLAGKYPVGGAGRHWSLAHGLLQNYPDRRVYGAVSKRNPGSS